MTPGGRTDGRGAGRPGSPVDVATWSPLRVALEDLAGAASALGAVVDVAWAGAGGSPDGVPAPRSAALGWLRAVYLRAAAAAVQADQAAGATDGDIAAALGIPAARLAGAARGARGAPGGGLPRLPAVPEALRLGGLRRSVARPAAAEAEAEPGEEPADGTRPGAGEGTPSRDPADRGGSTIHHPIEE